METPSQSDTTSFYDLYTDDVYQRFIERTFTKAYIDNIDDNKENTDMNTNFIYGYDGVHTKLFVSTNNEYFPICFINKFLEFIDFNFNGSISHKHTPIKIGSNYNSLYRRTNNYYESKNGINKLVLQRDFTPIKIKAVKSQEVTGLCSSILVEFIDLFPMIVEQDDRLSMEQRRFLISDFAYNRLGVLSNREISIHKGFSIREIEQLCFSYASFNQFESFDQQDSLLEDIKSTI